MHSVHEINPRQRRKNQRGERRCVYWHMGAGGRGGRGGCGRTGLACVRSLMSQAHLRKESLARRVAPTCGTLCANALAPFRIAHAGQPRPPLPPRPPRPPAGLQMLLHKVHRCKHKFTFINILFTNVNSVYVRELLRL